MLESKGEAWEAIPIFKNGRTETDHFIVKQILHPRFTRLLSEKGSQAT